MILSLVSVLALLLSLLISFAASSLVKPIILIPGIFRLYLSRNPGIAFGIHIPSPWEEIIIISALAAVCIVAVRSKPGRLASVGFGLIIGGAVANLVDRFQDGFVTDYFSVGTFPIFNAADSCITVGAALLLWEAWMKRPKKP